MSQLGIAIEATPGTYQTPTIWLPIHSANQTPVKDEKLYRDDEIIGGRVTSALPKLGRRIVGGSAVCKLPNVGGAAKLWTLLVGLGTTTGAGPYAHTYLLGAAQKYCTIQLGAEDAGGTTRPFTHLGCIITSWRITQDNRGWAILNFSWMGVDYATATALATASYPTLNPFAFPEFTLTADAVSVPVRNVEFGEEKKIDTERYYTGTRLAALGRKVGNPAVSGKFNTDFMDMTMATAIATADDLALVGTFDNGSQTLAFTMGVVLDGDFPNLSVAGMEPQELTFSRVVHPTADASAFSAVLTNTESAAS